jgi:hypothetical protein
VRGSASTFTQFLWIVAPKYHTMRMHTLLVSTAVLVVVICAAYLVGDWRWRQDSQAMLMRLDAAREPLQVTRFHRSELAELPAPVQRYLSLVLQDGQAIIAGARFTHRGSFNMSEGEPRWAAFTSQQVVITRRPGFDWHGRISAFMGLDVRVHDAYIAGVGELTAKLAGTVTLTDMRGTPELAQGELMRWLAEACWYPTALLPSQGVRWQAVDAQSARATFSDSGHEVSLLFHFGNDGLVDNIRSPARPRTVAGQVTTAPWRVRVWGYEERNGMRVPSEAEAAWQLPSGDLPYWRGRIGAVHFEWAQ